MILTKNGNDITFTTGVVSQETQLITDIVLSFKTALAPRDFIVLKENPTNNEAFAKITLSGKINNSCLCFLNGNETKKYMLSDEKIINSMYTLTQYSYTNYFQFSNSYLFYLTNSAIEESLLLGFSVNSKLQIIDDTHTTTIKASEATFGNTVSIPSLTAGGTLFPSTTGSTNQILKLSSAGVLGWANDVSGISQIDGTANQITASTTNNITTLSLPDVITKSESQIKYNSSGNNYFVQVDTSGTNIAEVKVSNAAGDRYAKNTYQGLHAIDGSNECICTPDGLFIKNASITTALYPNGLIMANNSFGSDGMFLCSKGPANPAQWTTFTQSQSVSIALSWGGNGSSYNAYTTTVLLTKIGNVVFGKMSLPSVASQNTVGSSQVYLYGSINTGVSTYTPTHSQMVGQVPLCYLSAPTTFTLFGYGSVIIGGSGNSVNMRINFSPTGTETSSTGVANNAYLALGADFVNSTITYNGYYTFQYLIA